MNSETGRAAAWYQRAAQTARSGAQAGREAAQLVGQLSAAGWRTAQSAWRVPVEGELPGGAAIIAVNHQNAQDAARLRGSLARKIVVLPTVDADRQARLPFSKQQGRAQLEQLALEALARGELVGIFPEGRPSPTGDLGPGDLELARLAIRAQVPIVPAAFCRAEDDLGRFWKLRLGAPIDVSRQAALVDLSDRLDRLVLRGVTDQVMTAIAQLSGQQYREVEAGAAGPEQPEQPELSDLQRAAEENYQRLQSEFLAAREQALAADQAEHDQLVAAAQAARQRSLRKAAARESSAAGGEPQTEASRSDE